MLTTSSKTMLTTYVPADPSAPSSAPSAPTLHRYYVRDGYAWALVIVGSDGLFTAVSDYGEYGHLWSTWGPEDFRAFLAEIIARGDDYFISKLSTRREIDGDATLRNIQEAIAEARRTGIVSACIANDELERLDAFRGNMSEIELELWHEHAATAIDYSDVRVDTYPQQLFAFVKLCQDHLVPMLRADLKNSAECTQ